MQWKSALLIIQIFLMVGLLTASCQTNQRSPKMNGISLLASRDSILDTEINYVVETEANYIALMPFGFLPDSQEPQLKFNINRQWFGERKEGIEHTVSKLRERNLKIMVKPQIWLRNGTFTGDLEFETEEDWKQFEDSYAEFILLYAEISEELEVPVEKENSPNREQWIRKARKSPLETAMVIRQWLEEEESFREQTGMNAGTS